jgi:hypothetical protein
MQLSEIPFGITDWSQVDHNRREAVHRGLTSYSRK